MLRGSVGVSSQSLVDVNLSVLSLSMLLVIPRSAFCRDESSGKKRVKQVPLSTLLAHSMSTPSCSLSCLTIESPKPKPKLV